MVSSDVSELQIRVAKALINKATDQVELEQHAEAITTLEEVAQRYGDSDEAALKVCSHNRWPSRQRRKIE